VSKQRISVLLGLLAWLLLPVARADILLLVHGYAADAGSWEFSGINTQLESRGWLRAGVFTPNASHMQFVPGPGQQAANKSYSINLPAQAPLQLQATLLRAVLDTLHNMHPGESLVLVGHSAGGVVARLALLGANSYEVDILITIASPHLGTVRAAQGLDVVDAKPFFCPGPGINILKSFFGGDDYNYLRYSRGVLLDLLPAESGNLLFWLNQQPHPEIEYYAVVRQTAFAMGDELVPAYSQDMNNVPALRGQAKVLMTATGHRLNLHDGQLLAGILEQ